MKKILELKLKILAKVILAKYKPEIIGITGSVGKTSAKEAIFAVLSFKHRVRQNIKNYNNEIGLPLTIIGVESQGKSLFGWLFVFLKALGLIIFKDKNYPEILILEMGIDRPGDMEYLLSIVDCKVGVVTRIGHSHFEFFGSVAKIKKEKSLLIRKLPKEGCAILNYDEEFYEEIKNMSRAKIISYGFNEGAMIQAKEAKIINFDQLKTGFAGINFKISYGGSSVPVGLPGSLAETSVQAALVGAATGIFYEMSLIDIASALAVSKPPRGRMNLIYGIKNTLIIDDTYNASPQSTIAALETFGKIKTDGRKFAILGDMLELGKYTEEGHRSVGEQVVASKISQLIVVGEKARDIARGAESKGMKKDNIFYFPNSEEARIFVQNRIGENDLILIKGSQGMRMEKIVKEIMAEPLRAEELLVRQDKEWQNK